MAVYKIIIAAIAALFISLTPAYADECVSIDRFDSIFASKGITLYGSRSAATKQMEAVVNQNRAKAGNPSLEASIFLVGYVKDDKGDIFAIVAIFDKNGCAIEETVVTLTIKQWFEFLASSGVEPKDFVTLSGA